MREAKLKPVDHCADFLRWFHFFNGTNGNLQADVRARLDRLMALVEARLEKRASLRRIGERPAYRKRTPT